jgi:hypothetical protein
MPPADMGGNAGKTGVGLALATPGCVKFFAGFHR